MFCTFGAGLRWSYWFCAILGGTRTQHPPQQGLVIHLLLAFHVPLRSKAEIDSLLESSGVEHLALVFEAASSYVGREVRAWGHRPQT